MSNFSLKKKANLHLFFLFILSLYYLIPYFFTGQLILKSHDILDSEIVYNHIIGRIYKGELESINLFIAGEIEWYFLRRIFQPLTLLYGFFQTETAFWLTDILVKLTCYVCFYKLSKKLNCSYFNSALLGCLYASSIDTWTHFGIGIATFPYLIYLLLKNKNLNLKHYLFLGFIGLNTDLVGDILITPMLFIVFLIFSPNYPKYNFKLFFKICSVVLFFVFLSNLNIIYSILFAGPFHRASFVYEGIDLITNLSHLLKNFFLIPTSNHSYFFYELPLTFFVIPTAVVGLFSKNNKTYLMLLVIFFMVFVSFLLDLKSIVSIRNSVEGISGLLFKSIHWSYMMHIVPALYGLVFITISNSVTIKKARYFVYSLIFLSLITFQIRISAVPLGKYLISFNSFNIEQKNQLRESFHNRKYVLLLENIIKFKKNGSNNLNKDFQSLYTFDGFYDYKNYRYIKSLINNARTVSIGLDPMKAVMNDIKVIDGYHNLYPLSYKLKFRKIIEEQLEYYPKIKKYYDNWGQRIYTFVSDPEVIKINFYKAKLLGADYVISKYRISNKMLQIICENCNDSHTLFVYKIKT